MSISLVGAATQLLVPVILKELLKDNVPVSNANAPLIADKVAEAVAPVLINKANAEPWYQSRVTWGALGSIATGLLALSGIMLTPEDTAQIVVIGTSAGALVSGVITLYGRWKARKPIGQ